jgi:hypothetical protein
VKPLVILLLLTLQAEQPVDCDQVKALVKHHGKVAAYTWALANGYSPKEISRIRKQCGI